MAGIFPSLKWIPYILSSFFLVTDVAIWSQISFPLSLFLSQVVTISNLLSICPPGLMSDPSPFLYDKGMFAIAGLATAATILHYNIREEILRNP